MTALLERVPEFRGFAGGPVVARDGSLVVVANSGRVCSLTGPLLAYIDALKESNPGDTITVNYIENQSYKQKIQLAMGAGNPPTIFWTWGGGPLKQFIDAGVDVAKHVAPER